MAEIYQLPESGSAGSLPFSIPLNGFGNGNGFGMNGIADLFGLAIIASIFGWNGNGFGGGMGGNGAGFLSNQLNNDSGRELIMNAVTSQGEASRTAKAAEFLECYEGVETYNNYLSENEAKSIVRNFINYDKSTGAKWSPDELFEAVEEMGGYTENKPYYNKWALYAVMNMVHSDHGRVIGKWVDGDAVKYVEFCYDLSISQLTDTDRPRFVRGYFGLD